MLVDLVQVTTSDGLRLHGALELPETPPAEPQAVDAWLCIHGTGSNFYAASTLAGLAPKLVAGGAAVLRANTRGHDVICTGPSAVGRPWQGSAFERVDESPRDLIAWIDFLRERGFNRIGLLGHSLGAVKAIFTLAAESPPEVALLVAVSPPRLSHEQFLRSSKGEIFRQTFDAAAALVRDGRGDELMRVTFPLAYYASAAAYVDRYGPEERYDVLRLLDRVRCPTLVTYGSREVHLDVAFGGMPEEVANLARVAPALKVAVIADADHIYTGCHDALAGRILSWAGRLQGSNEPGK